MVKTNASIDSRVYSTYKVINFLEMELENILIVMGVPSEDTSNEGMCFYRTSLFFHAIIKFEIFLSMIIFEVSHAPLMPH